MANEIVRTLTNEIVRLSFVAGAGGGGLLFFFSCFVFVFGTGYFKPREPVPYGDGAFRVPRVRPRANAVPHVETKSRGRQGKPRRRVQDRAGQLSVSTAAAKNPRIADLRLGVSFISITGIWKAMYFYTIVSVTAAGVRF